MKKLLFSVLTMAIAAITFSSCEDVPAPYGTPEKGKGEAGVYINTTFANSISPWVSFLDNGAPEGMHWTNAYSSAVCTGSYQEEGASSRSNHAGSAWLVSPTVDLTEAEQIRVSFDQAIAYERTSDIALHHELYISNDYVQGNDPSSATWTKIDIDYGTESHSGGNYSFTQTGATLTPAQVSATTTFALKYTSTASNASTWEVQNFLVMVGEYVPGGGDDETTAFKQATGITSGQTYVFVAPADGKYYAATALTGNYGYLPQAEVEVADGEVNAKENMKFTFTKVEGGYTIQDADGYYLYQTGTYNSFNRSESVPDAGQVWSVSFNDDGTVNVVNNAVSKTIQYSSQYSSWGSYASVSNILPFLYTDGETGGDKGEGGGGGSTEPTGDKGTTADNPYTVAEALAVINALADGGTTASEVYVKGKTTAEGSTFYFNSSYGQCNYYISADGSETNTIYVYNGVDLNGEKFTAAPSDWGKGTEVVLKGKLQKYVKDGTVTPEIYRGNYPVSITKATPGGSGGGGETSKGNTTKTVDDSAFTITFEVAGTTAGDYVDCDLTNTSVAHNTENPDFWLENVHFEFNAAEGKTTPKYWCTGSFNEFRMYALNTLTVTAEKKIAKVVFYCSDTYNGTKYTGNDQAYGTVDGSEFTFVNDWTSNSGGTQVRIKSVVIYYAK